MAHACGRRGHALEGQSVDDHRLLRIVRMGSDGVALIVRSQEIAFRRGKAAASKGRLAPRAALGLRLRTIGHAPQRPETPGALS